jgi:hypothetical protein
MIVMWRPLHFAAGKLICSVEHEGAGKRDTAPSEANSALQNSSDVWEQIKTGYAAGVNLREIARKMNIPEGSVWFTLKNSK